MKKYKLIVTIFVSSYCINAFSFWGGPMPFMTPNFSSMEKFMPKNPFFNGISSLALFACQSSAGPMIMNSSNMFSSFMSGMTGGALEQVINQEMFKTLSSPSSTLEALNCAKKNPSVIEMMFKAMNNNPILVDQLSYMMYQFEPIAISVFKLVDLTKDTKHLSIGLYLLENMTANSFHFFTEALLKYPWLAEKFVKIIKDNAVVAMKMDSHLMQTITHWGHPQKTYDANEYAFEKMLFVIFSNPKAAKMFQQVIHKQGIKLTHSLFDALLLGVVPSKKQFTKQNIFYIHKEQAYHNTYAMIYAMAKLGQKVQKGDLSPNILKQMSGHFMKEHIFAKPNTGKMFSKWGLNFMQVIVDAMAAKDPIVTGFAKSLMAGLPSGAMSNMPKPSKKLIKARKYLMKYMD